MFKGLPERLQKEVTRIAKTHYPIKVTRPDECKFVAWRGASAFAETMTEKSDWVNQDEFYEEGEEIISKKCT